MQDREIEKNRLKVRPSTRLKQQKIVEIASQLFIEQGFTQTSLDQIIEKCGGSKQTIYSYFGDKRGLLLAVISYCIERVGVVFTFKPELNKGLEQDLNQFGCDYISTILSPALLNIYRIIMTESQHDRELAEFYLTHGPNSVTNHLTLFLQYHMEQGNLKLADAHIACNQLISLLKGNHQQQALLGINIPTSKEITIHAKQAIECFLYGYK